MTQSIFYSSAADGRVNSVNTVYATARAGSNLDVSTTSGGGFVNQIGQNLVTGDYYCYQCFVDFDTSTIPDTDQIDSAVLSIYGETNDSTTDFIIEARLHDWGTTLETTDFVAGADLASKTLLGTWDTSTGFTTAAYTDLNSDAAFVSNINKTGVTRIVLASSRQRLSSTPTGAERVFIYLSEQAGTGQDPKLTVFHSAPVSGVYPSRALIGVGV